MGLEYLTGITLDFFSLVLPVLAIALFSSAIILALMRFPVSLSRPVSLFPSAFAIFGGIAGVIAGASFEPIVGGVITGVLGVVSALMSYAFTKESDLDTRLAIPAIIILLLVNALGGISVGQNWKKKWDIYANDLEESKKEYGEVWIPVNREYQLHVLRKCIDEKKTYLEARKLCKYETLFSGS